MSIKCGSCGSSGHLTNKCWYVIDSEDSDSQVETDISISVSQSREDSEKGWTTFSKKQKKQTTETEQKRNKQKRNDLYIQCKICKYYFDFLEEDSIKYASKGLARPKTCKQCIEKRHEQSLKKF